MNFACLNFASLSFNYLNIASLNFACLSFNYPNIASLNFACLGFNYLSLVCINLCLLKFTLFCFNYSFYFPDVLSGNIFIVNQGRNNSYCSFFPGILIKGRTFDCHQQVINIRKCWRICSSIISSSFGVSVIAGFFIDESPFNIIHIILLIL